jgi:hypothetical protein
MNPGGTGKDRAALRMIQDAEAKGLCANGTVVEGTSGSTGAKTGTHVDLGRLLAMRTHKIYIRIHLFTCTQDCHLYTLARRYCTSEYMSAARIQVCGGDAG